MSQNHPHHLRRRFPHPSVGVSSIFHADVASSVSEAAWWQETSRFPATSIWSIQFWAFFRVCNKPCAPSSSVSSPYVSKGAFHPVIDKWTVATSLPLAIGRFLLLRGQYPLGGVATHGIARYACRSACVTRSRGPQSRCVAVQPGVRARPAKPWAGCVLRAILRGTDDGAGGGSGSSEGFTKRVCGRVRRRCGERAFRNEGMRRERRV